MNQLFKKRKEQISIVQQFFNRVVKTEVKVVEASQLVICDGCKQAIAPESIKANQGVCIHCGYHMRIGAYDRLSLLLDEGTFREIDKKRTSFMLMISRDIKRNFISTSRQRMSMKRLFVEVGRLVVSR